MDESDVKVKKIIQKIKHVRESRGLSQFDLALKAGMTQGVYSNIELGRHIPSLKTIIKITTALELELNIETLSDDSREEAKEKIKKLIDELL